MNFASFKQAMALEVSVRRLTADDTVAYKRLRDDMLDGFPDAFTSDADTERNASGKPSSMSSRSRL